MGCEIVLLQDSPIKRGEQQGIRQRELLRARIAAFRAHCDKEKLDALEIQDRARLLTTTLNVMSQEWVQEVRAIATTAQVPAASLVALTQPPQKVLLRFMPKRANDLTAFASNYSGSNGSHGAKAILGENCDGPDIPHCVVSRSDTPGTLAYVALCEAGDMGVRAFVNEAGVAGTYHYGPEVEDHTGVKLPPSIVLRHICEKALSCKQVATEFKTLFDRMAPGNFDKRGVCYLFADGTGEVMLVEAGGVRFQKQSFNGSYITLTNKFQLVKQTQITLMEPFRQRVLRDQLTSGPVGLTRSLELMRCEKRSGVEKGACDADTRASFVAVVGAEPFRSFAMVTMGTPLFNPPIPCFPRVGVPEPLLNGTAWTQAFRQAEPSGERNTARLACEAAILQVVDGLSGTADNAAREQAIHAAWKHYEELHALAARLKNSNPTT